MIPVIFFICVILYMFNISKIYYSQGAMADDELISVLESLFKAITGNMVGPLQSTSPSPHGSSFPSPH